METHVQHRAADTERAPSITGYWEDIVKDSARFAGRRVRVTVLPAKSKPRAPRGKTVPVDEKTARFLDEFFGCWVGDDIRECLRSAYETRVETER